MQSARVGDVRKANGGRLSVVGRAGTNSRQRTTDNRSPAQCPNPKPSTNLVPSFPLVGAPTPAYTTLSRPRNESQTPPPVVACHSSELSPSRYTLPPSANPNSPCWPGTTNPIRVSGRRSSAEPYTEASPANRSGR